MNQGMLKNFGLTLAAIFLVFTVNIHAAVPRRSVPDAQIVAQAELVASGTHMEIYQHGATIDRSFLKVTESAYEQVQSVSGLKLDTATLGSKVRVYVSDAISVSHVWKGYQHPTDPKAIIFLNPRVYQGAMSGKNATHESHCGKSVQQRRKAARNLFGSSVKKLIDRFLVFHADPLSSNF